MPLKKFCRSNTKLFFIMKSLISSTPTFGVMYSKFLTDLNQSKGYGKILLDHSMRIAAEMGASCLLIRGDIKFFGKCGFIPAIERGIRYAKDPEATDLLCKELDEGFGITGTYSDPEPYFVAMRNPEAFEKYDAEFPPKEKLVLPGQLG